MDTGYDPQSRYAQHDVRMACEENRRAGIVSFAIATREDSAADMRFMFPGARYAVMRNVRELPRELTRIYARLTC
jgi:nitric oxide reductase activation protein